MGIADGSIFPFPIGFAVGAVVLADRRIWWAALLAVTLGNLVGGAFMYGLGATAVDAALAAMGGDTAAGFEALKARLKDNIVQVVFASSFPPTPFPVAALAAGAVDAPLAPTALAAASGKFLRYALIAIPLALFGDRAVSWWTARPLWLRRTIVLGVGLALLGFAVAQFV